MAVAIPVLSSKQSERFAATLYSPPETWISTERAFRNGITPGSSRWTSAPNERKSSSQESLRTFKVLIDILKTSLGDVDEDLERLLVFQQPHHFLVAIQTGHRVREDTLGDARIGVLAVREGLEAKLKVPPVRVHTGDQELVAEHPREVDLGGVERHIVIAARDARPDQSPVDREHLHRP